MATRKNKNSIRNTSLAIILLIISITSLLVLFGTYITLLFVPFFSQLKYLTFSNWDYTFWVIAWVMLHSYMIILCIEWLKEKSVKKDLKNTLILFIAMGFWGLIRKIGITEILVFLFYIPILYFINKTPSEKLSTKY